MNRNELFQTVSPDVYMGRSKFDLSHSRRCGFNEGMLYPICCKEILPGDTFEVDTNSLLRSMTPLYPVMDLCKLDLYWFFVPSRLTWEHWKEFCGENNSSAWIPESTYSVPMGKFSDLLSYVHSEDIGSEDAFGVNSLWNALGLPLVYPTYGNDEGAMEVSVLPFRGYHLIWNEYFRDQNVQDPFLVTASDTASPFEFFTMHESCRLHDYFSSALPAPQRGPSVFLPLVGSAQVTTGPVPTDRVYDTTKNPLYFKTSDLSVPDPDTYQYLLIKRFPEPSSSLSQVVVSKENIGEGGVSSDSTVRVQPLNLVLDTSTVTGASINAMRLAFATQRVYERMARSGSRYFEFLRTFFGVVAPDAVLQMPQYLGGSTLVVRNNQVVQTSSTSGSSPLGQTAAYSLTRGAHHDFDHSFTEHGYLYCLVTVRVSRSYSQGIEPMWTRKSFFDFYTPPLAHLGEQPIYKRELRATPNLSAEQGSKAEEVFGYKEAWTEYRFSQSRCTGQMDPVLQNGFQAWSYADYYSSGYPVLSSDWMKEGHSCVDQTLAVTSENAQQFFGEFWFDMKATRVMPSRSTPGLIDHF